MGGARGAGAQPTSVKQDVAHKLLEYLENPDGSLEHGKNIDLYYSTGDTGVQVRHSQILKDR